MSWSLTYTDPVTCVGVAWILFSLHLAAGLPRIALGIVKVFFLIGQAAFRRGRKSRTPTLRGFEPPDRPREISYRRYRARGRGRRFR